MKSFRDFEIWKNVSDEQWIDWKWQISHNINSLEQLSSIVDLTSEEYDGVKEATKDLKMRITPHIALMIAKGDHTDTLRRQCIPSITGVKTANIE